MLIFDRFALPEHSEISYQLSDGLNHINIQGGDAALISCLKDNFIGTPTPDDIPDWVIFFDRSFKLPSGGSSWSLLPDEDMDTMTSEDLAAMEDNISFGIQFMLKEKVKDSLQKFHHHASSSDELVARFSPGYCIKLFSTRHGGDISHNFQAVGEQIVLYLAINYAYRCHYYRNNNPPFVFSYRLRRYLEGCVETQIMEFINLMSHQVVVINVLRSMDRVATIGTGKLWVMAMPASRDEIKSLRYWDIDHVVSLLEADEQIEVGLADEEILCVRNGMRYTSFPISDRAVPQKADALALAATLYGDISNGEHVVIHCRAGIGRAGMIASAVLIQAGYSSGEAIHAVSWARGALVPDTEEQDSWIRSLDG